jgi:hypothetical protein
MPPRDEDERVATVCFCGRTHAPWWGRYVPAPSCDLKPSEVALQDFLHWRKARPDA